MAADNEKIAKDLITRTGCQSPEPENRPASPLTIGSIKTVTWQAQTAFAGPKPSLAKLRLDELEKEDISQLILNRKSSESAAAAAATNVGISYNYLQPAKSKK